MAEHGEPWGRYDRSTTVAPWIRAGVTLEEWRTTWSRLESLRDALKQEGLARGVPRESIENVLADVDRLLQRVEAGDPAVFATIHALK
ncbi:MAG: hypothetical protein M3O91_03815 [Chloroflexota bacterium]|nr:hypothetical protein [Chloroflexota bacterium]